MVSQFALTMLFANFKRKLGCVGVGGGTHLSCVHTCRAHARCRIHQKSEFATIEVHQYKHLM